MRLGGLVLLVALLGCDASPDTAGFATPDPANVRGDVDAGGAGGAIRRTGGAGAGGARGADAGSGGAALSSAGGAPGTGGMGAGGSQGKGGAAGGSGGALAPVLFCSSAGFPVTGYVACTKLVSIGVWAYGSLDGHACVTCENVPVTLECYASSARELCVASCTECVFQ